MGLVFDLTLVAHISLPDSVLCSCANRLQCWSRPQFFEICACFCIYPKST